MSDLGNENPEAATNKKPPKSDWEATRNERFFDLKFSHYIEIILTGALVGIAYFQYSVYTRQAGIMETQARISSDQNDITIQSARAIIYAKEVRIEKKSIADPVKPGQFEDLWQFSPVIENGGSTTTKNMRIGAVAAFDPTHRPEAEVKLPFFHKVGPKQYLYVRHLPDAGPLDPEEHLIREESLEQQGEQATITHTIVGPHVSQAITGFGIPIREAKRWMQEDARWFILGAIHYDDRFSNASNRLSKYCFSIGFEITASGELEPTTNPCLHWNCADEECKDDKAAYNAETANWSEPPMLVAPEDSPPNPNWPVPPQPPAAK